MGDNGNGKPVEHVPKHALTPEMEARKWKPGQSGNPSGRPKGPSITGQIRRLLKTMGKLKDGTLKKQRDILAQSLIANAVAGNGTAIREIMARVDGALLNQPVEVRTEVSVTVNVTPEPSRVASILEILDGAHALDRMVGDGNGNGSAAEIPQNGNGKS